MERETKRILSTALLLPVFTLTSIPLSVSRSEAQQSPNLIERIFSGNKHQQNNTATVQFKNNERLIQLEQAVRDLTMQVENLNIKMLENQNRIDVLEGKAPSNIAIAQSKKMPVNQLQSATNTPLVPTQNVQPRSITKTTTDNTSQAQENNRNGDMKNLGSIHFDRDGNILEKTNSLNEQSTIPTGGNQTTLVPQTSTSKELYQLGYQSILTGDYRAAEEIFRAFQERYAKDPLIADVSFWLGESLYGQGRYREAAQAYIDVDRNYNNAPRAPENMLKLGVTMAKLNDDDTACAVLAKVTQKYRQAEPAVLKRVKDEQKRINCSQ